MKKLIKTLSETFKVKNSLGDKYLEIKNRHPNMSHKEISDSVDAYVNYW